MLENQRAQPRHKIYSSFAAFTPHSHFERLAPPPASPRRPQDGWKQKAFTAMKRHAVDDHRMSNNDDETTRGIPRVHNEHWNRAAGGGD
mmetsp:Transcript_30558/g.64943  ORF Transcript_30558/g.64943 Transcript_30558/m.64943 type:complete len:89 (+) Transcript_30558:373-639(+)